MRGMPPPHISLANTFHQAEEVVRFVIVGFGFDIFIPEAACSDDDVHTLSSDFNEEGIAFLDPFNDLLLAGVMRAFCVEKSHTCDPFIWVLAWVFIDACNAIRHFKLSFC